MIGLVLIYATVSLTWPPAPGLLAFGDIAQFALLFLAFLVMVVNAISNRGQIRVFWSLMALGCLLWSGIWLCGLCMSGAAPYHPRTIRRGRHPFCARRALHGRGRAAASPVGSEETIFQHLEFPHAAGVLGFPLRVRCFSGRVRSAQRYALQSAL